jgi:hypothetical protein
MKRTRQNDVGVLRRFVQKEIDRHIEIEFFEHARDELIVRQRNFRIEAEREQAANFAPVDLAEQFVGIHARPRQFRFGNVPDFRDELPVVRVRNVARAGQLVALLTVFASALTVALTCNRGVAAVGPPDSP